MHLEIIDEKRIYLLNKLKTIDSINNFALGGGTGLSLLLGLRTSSDFDFFSSEHFNVDILLDELNDVFPHQVEVIRKEERLSILDVMISDVKVSFFEYKYPCLDDFILFDEFPPLKLLSIVDIACMKSIAVIQRGTKKDFFDLYFIIKYLALSAKGLLDLLDQKYHDNNVKYNLILSISFFDDADQDVLPLAFVDYSYENIKKFFISFQKELHKALN